jgi:hypothetical protein
MFLSEVPAARADRTFGNLEPFLTHTPDVEILLAGL